MTSSSKRDVRPVLVNGAWRVPSDVAQTFSAAAPAAGSDLPGEYPVSTWDEVEEAVLAGSRAAQELRGISPEVIASFLDAYAAGIEVHADDLVEMAHLETALPVEPRLRSVELPRTTDQLRQAAAATRDATWCEPTIDTATNIRSMFGPLDGPVVVFGPNNFPFAFNSSAGGDFAAAIAAGNPVIAKANTGHAGTTRILTEIALDAVRATGLPDAMVQMFYRTSREDGLRLVSHPLVGATGFTGSRYAGLQLKAAADAAGKPIYLEMSSINPIFILPGALRDRGDAIADEFYASCTLGAGQFCTSPGLVVVIAGAESERFLTEAANRFAAAPAGVLLSAAAPGVIAGAVAEMVSGGATVVAGGEPGDSDAFSFQATLIRVDGSRLLAEPAAMQTEAFGPVSLVVVAADPDEVATIIGFLEGNLTGTFYTATDGTDDDLYDWLAPMLRPKVGRLLNDKMPTGVAVVPSMNHGGPFPSTGHPGFTAVGIPASIRRFGALWSFDNVRLHRLPLLLRDDNPTGAVRLIDGVWTRGGV